MKHTCLINAEIWKPEEIKKFDIEYTYFKKEEIIKCYFKNKIDRTNFMNTLMKSVERIEYLPKDFL